MPSEKNQLHRRSTVTAGINGWEDSLSIIFMCKPPIIPNHHKHLATFTGQAMPKMVCMYECKSEEEALFDQN